MANYRENLRNSVSNIRKEYGTGRQMIRNALKACYDLYSNIMDDKNYYKPLLEYYKDRGFKVTKNTDAATKLVRLAIVEEAKKANPYAQVFRLAKKEKVQPEEFLDWIDARGGIERVRLNKDPLKDEEDGSDKTSLSFDQIEAKANEYVESLTPQAKVTFADGRGISFSGNVAMLVVKRNLDTDEVWNQPLEIVEVLGKDSNRTKSLLLHYCEQAS